MSKKRQPVTCDRCSKKFEPVVKEKPVKGGGAQMFIKCPRCRKQYPIANITAEGIKIRQEMQNATGDELMRLREEYAKHVTKPT